MGPPDASAREKLTTAALATWAVGVQLNELVAAVGCYATAALVLTQVPWKKAWPLLALVGWGAVTSLVHPPTFSGAARLCDWLLIPVAAAAATRARMKPVYVAALATALLSCAAAALQYFHLWPSQEALAPLAFTKIPFYRVYEFPGGLAFHRLKFATVTSLVVIATAQRGRWVPAVAGFIAVVVFPAARAAALSLGVALATLAKPRWLIVPLLAGASIALIQHRDLGERPALMQAALDELKEHPLTGVGLGRFHPSQFEAKAHNQWLTYAVEGGLPLALLFCGVLVWLARQPATRATLCFLILLCVLHDPLFHATTSQAVMLALGLAADASEPEARRATPSSSA